MFCNVNRARVHECSFRNNSRARGFYRQEEDEVDEDSDEEEEEEEEASSFVPLTTDDYRERLVQYLAIIDTTSNAPPRPFSY